MSVFTEGPLPADGETDSLVQLHVPGLGPDDDVRVSARGAKVVAQEAGPQGTFFVTLRPAAVDAPGTIDLVVKDKREGGVDSTLPVQVVPHGGGFVVAFEPGFLDRSEGGVLVRVRATDGAAWHVPALGASLGEVGALSPAGDGSWTALYAPPADLSRPAAALFTVTDLAAPEATVGYGVLPIRQPTTRKLDAPPGSTATLSVEGREIGTTTTDPEGLAAFDLTLGPGEATGTLSYETLEGETRSVTVDLDNPARPQVAFVPWPEGTGVPAGEPVTLWLAAVGADGVPRDRVPDLVVEAPGGAVTSAAGEGWHRVVVTAPSQPGPFTVNAGLGLASSRLSLRAVPPVPRLSMVPEPAVLGQASEVTVVTSWEAGRGGRGPAALTVRALGRQTPEAQVGESGAVLTVPLAGVPSLTLVATTTFVATGLPPARLRIWPGRTWAGSDEVVPLFVVVEDALGLPVPNQAVRLAPHSTLQGLPAEVDTGEQGYAMLPFTRSDDRIEPLPIRATSGRLGATTVLWPHSGSLGTAEDALARARWGRGLPTLWLQRDGEPLGTAVEEPPPGPPSRVEAVAEAEVEEARVVEPEARVRRRRVPGKPLAVRWEVAGGFADDGIRFAQESDDPDIPSRATFREPMPFGAFGAFGRAEAWLDSGFGAELFGRIGGYGVVVTGQTFKDSAGLWRLGARYRRWIVPMWGFQAGLGIQRTDGLGFAWDSDQISVVDESYAITGLRVGGEGLFQYRILLAHAGVWETFAIAPSITELFLRADVALPVSFEGMVLSVTATLDFEFRHLTRELQAGEVRIDQLDGVLLLGVSLGTVAAERH